MAVISYTLVSLLYTNYFEDKQNFFIEAVLFYFPLRGVEEWKIRTNWPSVSDKWLKGIFSHYIYSNSVLKV